VGQRFCTILRWELTGAVFIIVVGSALHFLYNWSGAWPPLALVAAVNESIWEHLKLAFWPGFIWALFPTKGHGPSVRERLAGKGFGLLLTAILIVALFKGYTAMLGRNFLPMDIGIFVLAVLIGQVAATVTTVRGMHDRPVLLLGLALLLSQFAAYILFTFFALEHWLFIDKSDEGLSTFP
jgi:hypothetical protein